MEAINSTLDDIASVIGFSATLKLAAWFGSVTSQNLYVPGKAEEGHTLARLIGMSAFRRLVDEWGNEHIAIPVGHQYARDLRNREIRDHFLLGQSDAQVAERFGMGTRRTTQLRREFEIAGLLPAPTVDGDAIGDVSELF